MVGGLVLVLVLGLMAVTVKPDEDQDANKISTCELSLAQLLLLPPDSMQVQALRREFFQYLEEKLQEEDDISKRSFVSLVRDGNLPYVPKRSLEALIRAGYFRPNDQEDKISYNDDYKKSIANLAKNGQLPTFQKQDELFEAKRGIESLARKGELHGKRELSSFLNELYDKRNIGSLARGFNFPIAGKRYLGALARTGDLRYSLPEDDSYDKRNIASIIRNNGKRSISSLVSSNNLPGGKRYLFDELKRNIASIARMNPIKFNGKRAVPTAALLRQDSYNSEKPYESSNDRHLKQDNDHKDENNTEEKRNISSLKAQMKSKFKRSVRENETATRNKRQADYWESNEEYPVPVYQNNNVYDYEELMHSLTGEYPNQEKRFLGRIPQMGRPKSTPSSRKTR